MAYTANENVNKISIFSYINQKVFVNITRSENEKKYTEKSLLNACMQMKLCLAIACMMILRFY